LPRHFGAVFEPPSLTPIVEHELVGGGVLDEPIALRRPGDKRGTLVP
jgi:hypothetical protein